jgi:hypothetical protein
MRAHQPVHVFFKQPTCQLTTKHQTKRSNRIFISPLPKRPDAYATVQVVELVQQLLAHGGYYDEGLEFVRLERVQVGALSFAGVCYLFHPKTARKTFSQTCILLADPNHHHTHFIPDCWHDGPRQRRPRRPQPAPALARQTGGVRPPRRSGAGGYLRAAA